jgi:hypothetical protein
MLLPNHGGLLQGCGVEPGLFFPYGEIHGGIDCGVAVRWLRWLVAKR